ncbi:hypothetical protein [Streptomyces sp. HNM0574]|uniref:hypothetical protein n=1 Tax=Streptomyces sp. HNM0574 TaxID=2714954 RepID=UPI00146F2BBD|nr:hypothetical protein [Streptomyces sp. HNM0574]NLU67609.1 hypothetical protein [Streptomyces sp. HNM0574]
MGIDSAGLRAARAAVFTAVCLTLSAGAHVLLSGAPLPLAPLLALSGAVFLVAFALAARERGFGRIAALLIPLELFADTVFTAGQHACYGKAAGPVAGPLRSFGVDLLCGGAVGTPLARVAGRPEALAQQGALTAPATPWLLLAAHVLVGLVAAAWLRRGEAALARLLRAAATVAFRPLRLVLLAWAAADEGTGAVGTRPVPAAARPRTQPLLTHSVHRRGPPVLVRAA